MTALDAMKAGFAAILGGMLVCLPNLVGCTGPLLGPIRSQDPNHAAPSDDPWAWARCLQASVRDGRVDYARLAERPENLDHVLTLLAAEPEPKDTGAVRTARLINAYNALAMRAGLERYLATGGDITKARAPHEDEYRFRFHGRLVTLADIRRRLVVEGGSDVRTLLALCPARADTMLSDRPFQPDTLDRQLSAVAAATVNDPKQVRVDHENQLLWVGDLIGREAPLFVRWCERRRGTGGVQLFDALLDLADDAGRRRLNAAIGYRMAVCPPEQRLNLYVPSVSR